MAKSFFIIISTLLLLLLISINMLSVSSQIDPPPPPPSPPPIIPLHELLPKYGLPGGLFPDSVKSYSLSQDDRIVIQLGTPCTVEFEYLMWYDTRITGKLSYGEITGLKGIQLQRLYVWFDVSEIRVDSPPTDDIYFHIMMFDNSLNMDQFNTLHSCSKQAASDQEKAIDHNNDDDDESSKALVRDDQ